MCNVPNGRNCTLFRKKFSPKILSSNYFHGFSDRRKRAGITQLHLMQVHQQRNQQLTRKHRWGIIFHRVNQVMQVTVVLRENRCRTDIIVVGIIEDFVDDEEEGVQEGTIVDGDGKQKS